MPERVCACHGVFTDSCVWYVFSIFTVYYIEDMTDRAAELDQMDDFQAILSLEREFPDWMVWREGKGRWLNSCFARCHATDAGASGEDWADLRDQIVRAMAKPDAGRPHRAPGRQAPPASPERTAAAVRHAQRR
jgi:hypothetical protein